LWLYSNFLLKQRSQTTKIPTPIVSTKTPDSRKVALS
jgi:hypothetical protein